MIESDLFVYGVSTFHRIIRMRTTQIQQNLVCCKWRRAHVLPVCVRTYITSLGWLRWWRRRCVHERDDGLRCIYLSEYRARKVLVRAKSSGEYSSRRVIYRRNFRQEIFLVKISFFFCFFRVRGVAVFRVRGLHFVFCSIFMTPCDLVIHMTLFICLSSFSICLSIILISAYVHVNNHAYFPPLPHWFTFIAISICVVCVMSYTYTHVCLECFLLCAKLNIHLCYGVYWFNHTPTHILILWFLLYFHFFICTSTKVRSFCLP